MGIVRDLGRVFLRAYKTDGVPSSGAHNPVKADGIATFDKIDEILATVGVGQSVGLIVKTTKALLDADLAHPQDTGAWVTNDPTPTNNGVYRKTGASGTGSWSKVMDFPGTVSSFTTAGTADARTATGSPPLIAHRAGVLMAMQFAAPPNADVCTLNVDGLGALPIVERDLTVVDAGRIIGQMVLTYSASLGGCYIIVAPTRPSTTMKRSHRASSFKVLTSGTSATRFTESNQTQTGVKFTTLSGTGLMMGRAFPLQVLSGDVMVAEFVPGGTLAAADGVALGVTFTVPTADDQLLSANGFAMTWRKDGVVQIYKNDGVTAHEQIPDFQISSAILTWAAADVLRMVLMQAPQSLGGMCLLYKNGNLCTAFYFTTTSFLGGYVWAGLRNQSAGAEITLNYVRQARIEPGSAKQVYVNSGKSQPGDGSINAPYNSLQNAMRLNEFCASSLTFSLFQNYQEIALGYLPIGELFRIEGVGWPASQLRGSRKVIGGWTKTAGRVNVYERPIVFNGITNPAAGVGIICTVGGPPQAVGAPGPNLTTSMFHYKFLGNNVSLATLDEAPGCCTTNTTTGVVYINSIVNTTRSLGATFERSRSGNVATLGINAHGVAVNALLNVTGVGGNGYNDRQVRVTEVPDANHVKYQSYGQNEANTADAAGLVFAYNSGDPATMTFEQPAYDHVLKIPMNKSATDVVGINVILAHLELGFSNSSVITISRCDMTACQNVTATGGYLGPGWNLDCCFGEIVGCRGIANGGDGFNMAGSLVAGGDPLEQMPVLVLTDCEGSYNSKDRGADGASAHFGTQLRINGGRYNGNGKAGFASYITDVHGAELSDNMDSGISWLGKQFYAIKGNAIGCVLNNNFNSIWITYDVAQDLGSFACVLGGGIHSSNARGAHIRLDAMPAAPAGFSIKGHLLKSGPAPVFGDIINNGPGTITLASPTYVT